MFDTKLFVDLIYQKHSYMKPRPFQSILFVSVAVLIAGISVSWQTKKSDDRYMQTYTDTTPRNKNVRDLDEALQGFNSEDLQKTIDAAMKDVAEAMKKIDMKKMQAYVNRALKEVDMEKVQKEVNEAMKNFDADKLRFQVAQAMKDVDMEKMQADVKKALASIDMNEIKVEMDKVKMELKDLKPTIEKEMIKVKEEVKKAKADQKEYKEFINKLDKEGALEKDDYTVTYKNGKLMIDGEEASKKTYRKNRAFLKKHPSFKLKD